VETIGSKRSYALIWCMPNNDDDDTQKKTSAKTRVYCMGVHLFTAIKQA